MSTPVSSPNKEIKGSCYECCPCDGSKKYGGFWIRLLAYFIDFVILFAFGRLIIFILPPAFVLLFDIIATWLYFTLQESSAMQATIGKRICRLKVADAYHLERISFGRANARYWSKIISSLILLIGYLMIGWTKRKQGLHDKIAHTVVLHESK